MNLKYKLLPILLLSVSFIFGQNINPKDSQIIKTENSTKYKHSLGSSLFMLGNLLEDTPEYILLTYGYQLNGKDRIFVEFNSWRYSEPLG